MSLNLLTSGLKLHNTWKVCVRKPSLLSNFGNHKKIIIFKMEFFFLDEKMEKWLNLRNGKSWKSTEQ